MAEDVRLIWAIMGLRSEEKAALQDVVDHLADRSLFSDLFRIATQNNILEKWLLGFAMAFIPCCMLLRAHKATDVDFNDLWIPLSLSFIIFGYSLRQVIFVPMERLGVLHLSTEQMLRTDVAPFLCLFF
eukprot:6955679-Prymnesium_polylepis.3